MTVRTDAGALAAPTAIRRLGRRAIAVGLAVAVVSLSAQVAIPLPFTPVPMTLQPLAVLVVGGVLGSAAGAAALAAYLLLGLSGAPVFSAGGSGLAWLLGPTGGYLLAFPAAAAVAGLAVGRAGARPLRVVLACVGAMAVIHAGGVAHLALVGYNATAAWRLGFVPFFTGDLLKVGLAALVVLFFGPRLRPLL